MLLKTLLSSIFIHLFLLAGNGAYSQCCEQLEIFNDTSCEIEIEVDDSSTPGCTETRNIPPGETVIVGGIGGGCCYDEITSLTIDDPCATSGCTVTNPLSCGDGCVEVCDDNPLKWECCSGVGEGSIVIGSSGSSCP